MGTDPALLGWQEEGGAEWGQPVTEGPEGLPLAKPTLEEAQQHGETEALMVVGPWVALMGPNHAGDRSSFPRYVATPLAGLLNVKEKVRLKATPNAVLERFYAATSKHPKQVRAQGVPRGVLGNEGGRGRAV